MIPLLLFASAIVTPLASGDSLPPLKGEFLTGREALLPNASSGRIALLAIGFTYESRFAVEAWIGRFRKDFGDKSGITFYEIPMIGGMARLGKWFIDSGMRSGTPKADHEHVITVYGGTDAWKQKLRYQAPNAAYLVLIDGRGVVRWLQSGAFDEKAYEQLVSATAALTNR